MKAERRQRFSAVVALTTRDALEGVAAWLLTSLPLHFHSNILRAMGYDGIGRYFQFRRIAESKTGR